ncbi:MAG: ribonucleotide-diphosphate reductase subunit beta, partial [Gammaproteobacteria bacterium]
MKQQGNNIMLDWDDPIESAKTSTVTGKINTASPADSQPAAPIVDAALQTLTPATEPVQKPAAKKTAKVASAPAPTPESTKPVRAEDKRIINGSADINQLAPFRYPWAWNYFLNANKNHWTPLDIAMAQDVHDYQHKLTLEERHVYENVLSYLTTSDILAMRNIGLAVMEKMTAPELQIYQARQVFEEAMHTWTYQHCIESIGLDQGEIYNRYRVVPEINEKIQIANR